MPAPKLTKSSGKCNPKFKNNFSFAFHLREVIPFTTMNTNTQYVCFIRQKQASVNKWISKQMKKIPTETLKITCEEVQVQ